MKQQISLTPSTDVIHVDDVRVADGVYAKSGDVIAYWIDNEMCFIMPNDPTKNDVRYETFKRAVECWNKCWDIFTLSGRRIVTENQLTVEDLKNTDLVGFVRKGEKYFIVPVGNGCFSAITSDYSTFWDNFNNSKVMCIPDDCDCLYRFTTAQELHKWLGED